MNEIKKIERLVVEVVTRLMEIWEAGEGSLEIKITDDNNQKKAKITGGKTGRI
ncbi:unnamed protein product [marine sediment metagenome]|uniref:Uncharacterized protein n=1 Tax=marine sediment metagenome TaxID=412755 RepID=X0YME3_9ZZZZ